MKVFLLSLADDARQRWIDEGDCNITTWKELFENFFNKELMNVSSNEEWEEFDYENPPNTTTNSYFKPYLNAQEKDDIEKEDERSQKKRKGNKSDLEINNEQPNKRVCKAEKFEAIKYSLGPNE
nr:hypothetical protein [Tanacetum cinerariifolium]GFB95516.1 hypothetical protein [Tanacetum cinerariifolium]